MAKCLSCQIYTKLCASRRRGCHDSYRTFRNAAVDPDSTQPYLILVCLAKSSADSMGDSILSTVRNAAKLAVYEDIMINVKNHHIPATIRVEMALKTKTSCWNSWTRKTTTSGNLLRGEVTALLHKRANSEPHWVDQAEFVDQDLRFLSTGMRVVPLIRTEPVKIKVSQQTLSWMVQGVLMAL